MLAAICSAADAMSRSLGRLMNNAAKPVSGQAALENQNQM
jgi:hypothetical protein